MSWEPSPPYRRKKSLLIGINYTGSAHQLQGCHTDIDAIADFISYRGYTNTRRNRVILSDLPGVPWSSPYYPTGRNILAAMDWLVAEPDCTLFLHCSGHGSQIEDRDGKRLTGLDDSIVPMDFEHEGQILSGVLHERLVTRMAPGCTLFIVLDCCHSGSAIELPFVYRSSGDRRINLPDNLKAGARLVEEAKDIMEGGLGVDRHMGEQEEEGLQEGEFAGQFGSEWKVVTMLSGCRDDQTSADALIQGENTGALTWAFLQTMRRVGSLMYV
ncbi:peptidase C14 [Amniculicola lignicola CBS 123094]|uniref:Peptidase C14 n=1 Tax=Amniculicola lignicola CBS 123094 TaxID=1392246 RepID=A0A6A5X2S4_9PLEO|nr:peptidase C14 [Amniculicola lignicola CBS 123094]